MFVKTFEKPSGNVPCGFTEGYSCVNLREPLWWAPWESSSGYVLCNLQRTIRKHSSEVIFTKLLENQGGFCEPYFMQPSENL